MEWTPRDRLPSQARPESRPEPDIPPRDRPGICPLAGPLVELVDRLVAAEASGSRDSLAEIRALTREVLELAGPDVVILRGDRALVPPREGGSPEARYRSFRVRELDDDELIPEGPEHDRRIGPTPGGLWDPPW